MKSVIYFLEFRRFSKENETSQTSNKIAWLELARAAENSDLQTGKLFASIYGKAPKEN